MHSHLKQVGVCHGCAALVVGVALLGALWTAASSTLPQVLQGSPLKTGSDFEVVGEQEKLPALFQLSLDLNKDRSTQLYYSMSVTVYVVRLLTCVSLYIYNIMCCIKVGSEQFF